MIQEEIYAILNSETVIRTRLDMKNPKQKGLKFRMETNINRKVN